MKELATQIRLYLSGVFLGWALDILPVDHVNTYKLVALIIAYYDWDLEEDHEHSTCSSSSYSGKHANNDSCRTG